METNFMHCCFWVLFLQLLKMCQQHNWLVDMVNKLLYFDGISKVNEHILRGGFFLCKCENKFKRKFEI